MAEIVNKKREQTMRYTDEEIGVVKNTFAENDYLIKVLRKFFLQGTLTSDEVNVIRSFTSQPNSVSVLKKTLMPTLELEAPAFQLVDLYINIETKDSSPEKAFLLARARDMMCDYFEDQFLILADKKPTHNIVFKGLERAEGKEVDQAYIELNCRNTLISHIEFQLLQLKTLAGLKEETVEDTKARLAEQARKNSTK